MDTIIETIKKYWLIVLGFFGVLIVSMGAIFGRQRVQKNEASNIHKAHVSGADAAIIANEKDEKRKADALKESNEKLIMLEVQVEKETKELSKKSPEELTDLVATKLKFKNGDIK